jgi:hypothetical protein
MYSQKTKETFQLFLDASDFDDHQKKLLKHQRTHILNHALRNIGLDYKYQLSKDDQSRLFTELKQIINFAGNAVPIFDEPSYIKPAKGASDADKLEIHAQNLLKFLLVGTPFELSTLNQKIIRQSLLTKRSPEFMKAMREGFHDIFNSISLARLNKLDAAGERRFEIQLANMLAMYTLCDPYEQKELIIPQKINGKWEHVVYDIDPIELKPDEHQNPELYKLYADESGEVYDPNQKVYAYGLRPRNNPDASPHLLFTGTPPETGQGHLFATLTDFTPNASVGETMYRYGRKNIHAWLKKNCQHKKAVVTGQSLGGALSLFTAADAPQYVERVEAFNPPGFMKRTFEGFLFNNWNNTKDADKPKVTAHLQQYDPVKLNGYFHPDWQVTKTFPKKHEKFLSSYWAHIKSFANEAGAVCLNVNVLQENKRSLRKKVTSLKHKFDSTIHKNITNKIIKHNKQAAKKRHGFFKAKDTPPAEIKERKKPRRKN